ncbi:MAG: hypothetical protein HY323_09825, partial [Betaproteobacteria bacterium]|nr:hypothetical protein [Betaproteobacteria bacterium]
TSKALAATVTACTGVACRVPGTLLQRHLSERGRTAKRIVIGHPSGTIPVEAEVVDGSVAIKTAKIFRTARRIAEGRVYLKRPLASGAAPGTPRVRALA